MTGTTPPLLGEPALEWNGVVLETGQGGCLNAREEVRPRAEGLCPPKLPLGPGWQKLEREPRSHFRTVSFGFSFVLLSSRSIIPLKSHTLTDKAAVKPTNTRQQTLAPLTSDRLTTYQQPPQSSSPSLYQLHDPLSCRHEAREGSGSSAADVATRPCV